MIDLDWDIFTNNIREPLINLWRVALPLNALRSRLRILPSVPAIGVDPRLDGDEFTRQAECRRINQGLLSESIVLNFVNRLIKRGRN